jgi:Family of unknown function (DUF6941)
VINFAAAGLVRVPWTATNTEHVLRFDLTTGDGQKPRLAGGETAQPADISGEMRFNVGRPPQLASGDGQMVPFAFNFQGLPLASPGRLVLAFFLDGTEARTGPFTVVVDPPQGFRGPGAVPPLPPVS